MDKKKVRNLQNHRPKFDYEMTHEKKVCCHFHCSIPICKLFIMVIWNPQRISIILHQHPFSIFLLFTLNWNCFFLNLNHLYARSLHGVWNKYSGFIMCAWNTELLQRAETTHTEKKTHKTKIYIYCADFSSFSWAFHWHLGNCMMSDTHDKKMIPKKVGRKSFVCFFFISANNSQSEEKKKRKNMMKNKTHE